MSNSSQESNEGESAAYEDDKFEQEEDENKEYSYSDDSISSNESIKDSELTSATSKSSYSKDSFCLLKKSQLDNPQSSMRKLSSSPGIIHNNCNKKKNMTFSNMETIRIERENQYLLGKIMAQQRQKKTIQPQIILGRPSSSGINRKKKQQQIDADNITILKKIQGAKSSSLISNKMMHGGIRQSSLH